jgi:hypothetical protein
VASSLFWYNFRAIEGGVSGHEDAAKNLAVQFEARTESADGRGNSPCSFEEGVLCMSHALHTALEVTISLVCLGILIWPGSVGNQMDGEREDRERRMV